MVRSREQRVFECSSAGADMPEHPVRRRSRMGMRHVATKERRTLLLRRFISMIGDRNVVTTNEENNLERRLCIVMTDWKIAVRTYVHV